MAVNKINLERDGLIVGDTQLVTSGGGVSVGKNLVVIGNSYARNSEVINNLTVNGNVSLNSNLYVANNLGIGTASPTAKFQISAVGGSNPNFVMSGPGEQTFRFYNTALTGSTRVSWKMASRLNTDWEWIWYTDSTGAGINDLTLANQSGTVLNISPTRTASLSGNLFLPGMLTASNRIWLSPNQGNFVSWDGSGTQFGGNVYYYVNTAGAFYVQNTIVARGAITNDLNSGTLLLGSATSNVIIANAQATISPGTGALIVSGGAGVGGNLFVGGNISLVSTNPQSAVVNTRINPRFTNAAATSGTITINSDIHDQYQVVVNGTATFAVPSGTPVDGQKLTIRVKDSGTRQTISFTTGANGFRGVGLSLPTVSTAAVLYLGCVWNVHDSRWDAIALASL